MICKCGKIILFIIQNSYIKNKTIINYNYKGIKYIV